MQAEVRIYLTRDNQYSRELAVLQFRLFQNNQSSRKLALTGLRNYPDRVAGPEGGFEGITVWNG